MNQTHKTLAEIEDYFRVSLAADGYAATPKVTIRPALDDEREQDPCNWRADEGTVGDSELRQSAIAQIYAELAPRYYVDCIPSVDTMRL